MKALFRYIAFTLVTIVLVQCTNKRNVVQVVEEPLWIDQMQSGDTMVIFCSDNYVWTNRVGSSFNHSFARFILFKVDSELYLKSSVAVYIELFPEKIDFARCTYDIKYFDRFFNDNVWCPKSNYRDNDCNANVTLEFSKSDTMYYDKIIGRFRDWERSEPKFDLLTKGDYSHQSNEREKYRSLRVYHNTPYFREYIVHYKGMVKRIYHEGGSVGTFSLSRESDKKNIIYAPGERPWTEKE